MNFIGSMINSFSSSVEELVEQPVQQDIKINISQRFEDENNLKFLVTVLNKYSNIPRKRLFLLLDVSGSMSGLRLDLVKHACKVIISASNELVEISIFTFSSECKMITPLCTMTEQNKRSSISSIERLRVEGSTNLLLGLEITMNNIKELFNSNQDLIDTHLLIFTDGAPDNTIFGNYSNLLSSYFDKNVNCIIDLFGFSTSLNLDVMKTIYTIGKGTFGFISDKNMLATIFNNYLANLFSTSVKDAFISYEVENIDDKTITIVNHHIGNLLSMQERNFMIQIPKNHILGFFRLTYIDLVTYEMKNLTFEYDSVFEEIILSKYHLHNIRFELNTILIEDLGNVQSGILDKRLMALYVKSKPLLSCTEDSFESISKIESLLNDIYSEDVNKGQITKAIKQMSSWGKYYWLSIAQAHINQVTINFKDESLKWYSGPIAFEIVEKLNTLFNSITFVTSNYSSPSFISSSSSSPSLVPTAASYNHRDNACFAGTCTTAVYRENKFQDIPLSELKAGDIIDFDDDFKTIIQYIIQTPDYCGYMYCNGSLIGTGNHPVIYQNQWMYLKDVPGSVLISDFRGNIYTFSAIKIMNDKQVNVSSIIIEGFQCSTFGHGDLDKSVDDENYSLLSSTFWGKTILDIMHKSNKDGLLILDDKYEFVKCPLNKWIIDLVNNLHL